jgi:hypothetical protein
VETEDEWISDYNPEPQKQELTKTSQTPIKKIMTRKQKRSHPSKIYRRDHSSSDSSDSSSSSSESD